MARTSYIELDSATQDAYYGALQSGDRFIFPRISRKINLLSRKHKKGLSQKTLLPTCSLEWQSFTTEQKNAWAAAGALTKLSNWKLFVKEKCYKIVNNLAGNPVPSLYHQGLVGQIHIEAPQSEVKIFQPHPYSYFVSHKVAGKKGMYSPVEIIEKLALPLKIQLNYKSDLVAVGDGAFAKYYAVVRRLYQGRNIDTTLEVSLDLQSDWQTAENTLSFILGQYTSYSLYLHLYNVTGDLFFDNIKVEHNSQNWARDPNCDDINQEFTRAFYQVPKHWAPLVIDGNSFFESVYIED
jgi:hypothetical protein